MIENVSTQLTVFHCLCPLPASRKGLPLPLRSALFGEGGRDWRPCTGVYLLDFFCSSIQFYLLLSPYLFFISLLYLDLYVLGDDALIS